VKWVDGEYAAGLVPSVPSRDNVGECLGSQELPAKQSYAITIAGTLASYGRRNPDDAKDQARQLWIAAYEWKRARIDPQVLRYMRDRTPRLADQPNRALLEILIKLPS
jgi:hypothetical protein